MFINKLDRLVLELKLPPSDAYFKLKHTLDDINSVIKKYENLHEGKQAFISPINGNVVFGSTIFGCCFSIQSFANRYADSLTVGLSATKFEKQS